MSKKKNKKKRSASVGTGNASKKKRESQSFKLPKVSETKHPAPVTVGQRIATIVELVVVCVVWMVAAFNLFDNDDAMSAFLVGVVYFVGAFSMYMVRAAIEAKRRYGKVNGDTLLYYNQMVIGDQKWSLYIGMSFFAVSIVLRWLFPSPNFNMVGIDIATSFYLGYIWSAKYKGEETLPFEYMETIFLLLTTVTNYIVYFCS